MLSSAYGLRQYFQDLGHSFSRTSQPANNIYLSKFVKIQKSYFHLLWFRFFAWSTHSPHHARESFSKSFKMRHGDGKMTLQKLINSSGRNSLKFGVLHVLSYTSWSRNPGVSFFFLFSHSLLGVETFCHKDSQLYKPIKFWLLRRTHCQGLSRHKLLATTKCPAAGHGLN